MRTLVAMLVVTVLGLTACQGNTSPTTNASAGATLNAAPSQTASPAKAFNKPLGDILTEAGFGKTDFSVSSNGQSAIVKVQGTPCEIEVVGWQENTYVVNKIGGRVLTDLSRTLSDQLGGQSPKAETVMAVVRAAYNSGQLTC